MNPDQQPYDPNQLPTGTPQMVPGQPQVYGPAQPPLGVQQPAPATKSKLPIFIIAGAVALVLIIILAVIFASSGAKKATTKNPAPTTSTPQGPQAAKAIDVEQVSNSLSQDVSSMNDDKDLPATVLDDKSIGL